MVGGLPFGIGNGGVGGCEMSILSEPELKLLLSWSSLPLAIDSAGVAVFVRSTSMPFARVVVVVVVASMKWHLWHMTGAFPFSGTTALLTGQKKGEMVVPHFSHSTSGAFNSVVGAAVGMARAWSRR